MKQTLLIAGMAFSSLAYAQNAPGLTIHDTRNTNDLPAAYNYEVKAEFKSRVAVGVPGTGNHSGMLTIAPWGDSTGNKRHQLNFNDGGIFYRNGLSTDPQWGTWSSLLTQSSDGRVKIGLNDPDTTSPASLRIYNNENTLFELANSVGRFQIAKVSCNGCYGGLIGDTVLRNLGNSHNIIIAQPNDNNDGNTFIGFQDATRGIWIKFLNNGIAKFDGKIHAKEVEVKANVWADYVFKKDYQLKSLEEVEKHIAEKGHLPNIPSADEVMEKGINVAEMNTKLLEKIEELTLYSIEQNKQLKSQSDKIEKLEQQVQQFLTTQK
ncbi:cell wall anchor protein [Chryseobacterium lactis]|uniref:Cell wall anchor protein n=1 Tax=Chryseobacterium lactis TaxID=1241981 RepID=A0A3G6RP97_CHRLC|nr:cell wall anchor protein [Chryseobacterium lactis]AZA81757.1 cell wall anchor protein [Chryseobacterium lactis]AZB06755.1 cell wall anchor protein [Chryseobacterium lactis]PNW15606.1 cell wall anchor protein [Chryseobacterium lactis]